MNTQALLSLLHLTSPSLPIGAFAYSQGLESAVEMGWVNSEESLHEWLSPILSHAQANLDIPLLKRLYTAWQADDLAQVQYWQQVLLANRETRELLQEEQKLGLTFYRLLGSLGIGLPVQAREFSYLVLFAKACVHYGIDIHGCCSAWLWAWLENQVAAACKTVPLGQTSAQKVLLAMMPEIEQAIEHGLAVHDENIGMTLPAFAMASAWHETQYSRLFRS
ncbi:urease accessory protein UreF [Reinekea marinisedimentorum]|uniref:Urease accessory protein UreF n=1 Tax=Reinekea marinisedimentorum TaxID=230495 RepID=A0A4R3I002_9GAMM|nr:urease accessory UreF family protein [Reinekea marinisedimentorum]TCS38996.1 urease accessory protein [Reinekea marinisedimentorum]